MTKRLKALLGGLLVSGLMVGAAHADVVTQVFTGEVTNVGAASGVSLGDTVTGTLIYDTDQVAASASSTVAKYASYSFTIEVDAITATQTPGSFLLVGNNATTSITYDGLLTDGTSIGGAGFSLLDPSATAFNSTDLPTDLTLSDFTSFYMAIPFASGALVANITNVETSIQPTSEVPLPASLPLFLVGFAGLWARQRRASKS